MFSRIGFIISIELSKLTLADFLRINVPVRVVSNDIMKNKKTCYFGKSYFPYSCQNLLSGNTAYVTIFGKYSQHNALRNFVNPLTAAAGGSRRHADAVYGVNATAERTPGAANVLQGSAVLPTRPKSPGKSWDGWEKLGRLLFVILF